MSQYRLNVHGHLVQGGVKAGLPQMGRLLAGSNCSTLETFSSLKKRQSFRGSSVIRAAAADSFAQSTLDPVEKCVFVRKEWINCIIKQCIVDTGLVVDVLGCFGGFQCGGRNPGGRW